MESIDFNRIVRNSMSERPDDLNFDAPPVENSPQTREDEMDDLFALMSRNDDDIDGDKKE